MTARLLVLWGVPAAADAFYDVYREAHLPLVRALPGITRVDVTRLRSKQYAVLAELWFPDVDALRASLGTEQGAALAQHTKDLEAHFSVTSAATIVGAPDLAVG